MTGHQEGRYIPPRRERDRIARRSQKRFAVWWLAVAGVRAGRNRVTVVHARMAASLVLPLIPARLALILFALQRDRMKVQQ